MTSDITGTCKIFHQYGFSCAFSEYQLQKMISDIAGTYMVFHQYGFSCVFSYNAEQMFSDISGTCMVFCQYGISHAHSRNLLLQKIYHKTGISMVSLQYVFSCAFSENKHD